MSESEISNVNKHLENDSNMRKKSESETKPPLAQDEDSEGTEEQPLDIGEHYLVRRSDDSWRKLSLKKLKLFELYYFRSG